MADVPEVVPDALEVPVEVDIRPLDKTPPAPAASAALKPCKCALIECERTECEVGAEGSETEAAGTDEVEDEADREEVEVEVGGEETEER